MYNLDELGEKKEVVPFQELFIILRLLFLFFFFFFRLIFLNQHNIIRKKRSCAFSRTLYYFKIDLLKST